MYKKIRDKIMKKKEDAADTSAKVAEEPQVEHSIPPEEAFIALQVFVDTLNGIQYF